MELDAYETTLFGSAVRTPGRHGYVAYLPNPMPRELPLASDVVELLADAEAALGRLAGAGRLLPNPHLLIAPYLRREALASTRIEGTQASLPELLTHQARGGAASADLEEVLNYVTAMETGLAGLGTLPISKRLLRTIHAQLLDGVRGRERQPGRFRTTQNWIGSAGATIETASFVPPPPDLVEPLLDDWERAANEQRGLPVLVRCALLHYQLETIHPFLDGNGRLGRLVIVFHLVASGRLPSPILYLSPFFEANRQEYYDRLQGVRERGDADGFLRFFLRGIEAQANDAVRRAERLVDVRERYRQDVLTSSRGAAIELVDLVVEHPILTTRLVQRRLGVTRPTALKALRELEDRGYLVAETGARNQITWTAREIVDLLDAGTV